MIRVFLADDHSVLRDGLRRILSDVDDMAVVGETGDGREVLRLVGAGAWDVLVLDLSLVGRSGLEVLHDLRAMGSPTRVLVLSMHAMGSVVDRVFQAGAMGFLSKGEPAATVIEAIRAVASGARFGAGAAAATPPSGAERHHGDLSARQLEILVLVGRGLSPSDIANALDLRASTVSTHLQRIKTALGLRTNGELAQYALRAGLVV
jgi:two-component system invasion response regulator UvrY